MRAAARAASTRSPSRNIVRFIEFGSHVPRLSLPMVLGAVVGLVLTGLFIVFAGQMARALFDQANAVRDLVALERARIGSD